MYKAQVLLILLIFIVNYSFSIAKIDFPNDTIKIESGEYKQLYFSLNIENESVPLILEHSVGFNISLSHQLIFSPYSEAENLSFEISVPNDVEPGFYNHYIRVKNSEVYDSLSLIIEVKADFCDDWTKTERVLYDSYYRNIINHDGHLMVYNKNDKTIYQYDTTLNSLEKSLSVPLVITNSGFKSDNIFFDDDFNPVTIHDNYIGRFRSNSWNYYPISSGLSKDNCVIDSSNNLRYYQNNTLFSPEKGSFISLSHDSISRFGKISGPFISQYEELFMVFSDAVKGEIMFAYFNDNSISRTENIFVYNGESEETTVSYSSLGNQVIVDNVLWGEVGIGGSKYILSFNLQTENQYFWEVLKDPKEREYYLIVNDTIKHRSVEKGIGYPGELFNSIDYMKIFVVDGVTYLDIRNHENSYLLVLINNNWEKIFENYLGVRSGGISDHEFFINDKTSLSFVEFHADNEIGFNIEEYNCVDCNGDFGGVALINYCGVCAGGNTGLEFDECILNDEQVSIEEELTLYPNPTNGIINSSQEVTWEAVNVMGEIVSRGYGNSIDLLNQKNGLYFIRIANGQTIKVVKL